MSEPIDILEYPNLNIHHLEILPVFSARLQYHEIPSSAPMMSSDEKVAFLDILIKCVTPYVGDTETELKFQQLLCTWVALGTTYMGTGPNGLDKGSL